MRLILLDLLSIFGEIWTARNASIKHAVDVILKHVVCIRRSSPRRGVRHAAEGLRDRRAVGAVPEAGNNCNSNDNNDNNNNDNNNNIVATIIIICIIMYDIIIIIIKCIDNIMCLRCLLPAGRRREDDELPSCGLNDFQTTGTGT